MGNISNRRESISKVMIGYVIDKGYNLILQDNHYRAASDQFILGLQVGFITIEWDQDRTHLSNHREPITKNMVKFLQDKVSSVPQPDNLRTVMGDQLIMSPQIGFRRIEWAQDNIYLKKFKNYQCNINGFSSAFLASDFEFRGTNGHRLDTTSLPSLDLISNVYHTWRYQNNNNNGQPITCVKYYIFPHLCAVTTAHTIISRVHRLSITTYNPSVVFTSQCRSTQ